MSETNLLDEELKMLVRASRNERFRFIIIQYNHFSLIEKVKKTLLETYSDRNSCNINLNKIDQKDFIQSILNCKNGFIFIEEFENLLQENFRSLAIGFNQRRDKFSEYPITIIAFLPTGEKYLQQCQTIMPDVFSLVNPIIQLNEEITSNIHIKANNDIQDNTFKNYEEALDEINQIEKRLKSLEKIPENLNLKYNLTIRMCSAYSFLGNYKFALKLLSDLLNSKEKKQFSSEQFSILYNDIGVIHSYLGNNKKALVFYNKSLNNRLKDKILNEIELSILYNNIGESYKSINKLNKALEYLHKGLDILKLKNGNLNYNASVIYSNLGLVYENLDDLTKAKECFDIDLDYNLSTFGKYHPNSAISYANLGSLSTKQKNYFEALKFNELSLEIRLKIYDNSHPDIANSYNNIGAIYSLTGNYKKAETYYQKSFDILINILGKDHPATKFVKENILLLQK